MKFEWDEDKNKLNKMKHGISFETAILVFADPERLELYDDSPSVTFTKFYGYISTLNILKLQYKFITAI